MCGIQYKNGRNAIAFLIAALLAFVYTPFFDAGVYAESDETVLETEIPAPDSAKMPDGDVAEASGGGLSEDPGRSGTLQALSVTLSGDENILLTEATDTEIYQLSPDAAGTISFSTADGAQRRVTVVGNGSEHAANNVTIRMDKGIDLTIRDVYLSFPARPDRILIDFTGAGAGGANRLDIEGVNRVESNVAGVGSALIHVKSGVDLTLGGSGSCYMQKNAVGACIGSIANEAVGNIIFEGGNWYLRGNGGGACIGMGGTTNLNVGGNIAVNGGNIYGVSINQAAVIGGNSGSDGINIQISGGNLTLISDLRGPAIGLGASRFSQPLTNGGILTVSGGSLKTFVTANGYNAGQWTVQGLTDLNIKAIKQNAAGEPVECLIFDTELLDTPASSFDAFLDGTPFYSGGLHGYEYLGGAVAPVSINSWASSQDKNLYFYVPADASQLTVNGEVFDIVRDQDTGKLKVEPQDSGPAEAEGVDTSWYNTVDDSFTLMTAAHLMGLSAISNGRSARFAADNFEGKTLVLGSDVDLSGVSWSAIGLSTAFKGVFDGSGHTVTWGGNIVNGGFFWVVGSGAVIKNLTMAGTVYGSGIHGVFAGRLDGGRIENCINEADFADSANISSGNKGGFVGELTGGGQIVDCINRGGLIPDPTGVFSNFGGIVGRALGSGGAIEGCLNEGEIVSTSVAIGNVGGIAGQMRGSIIRTENRGAVAGSSNIGGIVGSAPDGLVIRDVVNKGDILAWSTGTGLGSGVAGIVGNAGSHLQMSRCVNVGNITGYIAVTGGIVGFISGGDSITYCYNEGKVTGRSGRNGSGIGGIIGMKNYGFTTRNNYNTGKLCYIAPPDISTAITYFISPTFALRGEVWTGTDVGDNYYSDDCTDQILTLRPDYETVVTPENAQTVKALLKNCTDEYVLIGAGGYPIIIWDKDVWDGVNADTDWYNANDSSFELSNPYELAGLAMIVNNKPEDSDAGAAEGLISWLPADDFIGKVVKLTADVDLGGRMVSSGNLEGDAWSSPVWEGSEWVPIASYSSNGTHGAGSGDGVYGRPFKGYFDGGFHEIQNLYVPGDPAAGTNSSKTNGHALFGDLGRDGVVANVILKSGYVRGARFTGGIVGRNWGHVSRCANYATVETDGSRSGGGITGVNYKNGAAWDPWVMDCFNFGIVVTGDIANPGGITGDNEGLIENCYNAGKGMNKTDSSKYIMGGIVGGARGVGTVTNSYSLSETGYPDRIAGASGGAISSDSGLKTEVEMISQDFISVINGEGRAFVSDTTGANHGYPVFRGAYTPDDGVFTAFEQVGAPERLSYVEGQIFEIKGFKVRAQYDDGSAETVSQLALSTPGALAAGDTAVIITAYHGTSQAAFSFGITVLENALTNLLITSEPTVKIYTEGDAFKRDGLKLTAGFLNGQSRVLDDDEYSVIPETLALGVTFVAILYTYRNYTTVCAITGLTVNKRTENPGNGQNNNPPPGENQNNNQESGPNHQSESGQNANPPGGSQSSNQSGGSRNSGGSGIGFVSDIGNGTGAGTDAVANDAQVADTGAETGSKTPIAEDKTPLADVSDKSDSGQSGGGMSVWAAIALAAAVALLVGILTYILTRRRYDRKSMDSYRTQAG
jgi:hypothetical protein